MVHNPTKERTTNRVITLRMSIFNKLEEIRKKRLSQKNKRDESDIVMEAIELLYAKEFKPKTI